FGLAQELNLEAEGIEIGPSPVEAEHVAAYSMPIEDLNLAVRSLNCFKREGVHTAGALIQRSESGRVDIRSVGQTSTDEVKLALAQLGLGVKDSPPEFDPAAVAGYDPETGGWTDGDGEDYAETEQL